ncbi:MAG: hypothetical protein NZ602_03280 [Thermoguttaceae bacterium]|nr:hypothetical protein [Thermoguttaceae bacterium]MDW8037909.1 hypothetical protein [Thermoguttaceae bacterium]
MKAEQQALIRYRLEMAIGIYTSFRTHRMLGETGRPGHNIL